MNGFKERREEEMDGRYIKLGELIKNIDIDPI